MKATTSKDQKDNNEPKVTIQPAEDLKSSINWTWTMDNSESQGKIITNCVLHNKHHYHVFQLIILFNIIILGNVNSCVHKIVYISIHKGTLVKMVSIQIKENYSHFGI